MPGVGFGFEAVGQGGCLIAGLQGLRGLLIAEKALGLIVNPIKLEIGLRPNSAGSTYALLLRIEAIGIPTFGLLL